jgi:cytoskeletal protein RodZ
MSDFGGKLREARERRGVSLRDIAAHTKFSIASLEALERNDSSRLPGGIFARAFVRSYAAEVGLDPEATVREFVERFDIEPPLSTLDVFGTHTGPDHAGDARSRVIPTVLKLVMISLVAMAIIFYFARLRNTEESSGLTPADARRTSRRLGSPVPAGRQLP